MTSNELAPLSVRRERERLARKRIQEARFCRRRADTKTSAHTLLIRTNVRCASRCFTVGRSPLLSCERGRSFSGRASDNCRWRLHACSIVRADENLTFYKLQVPDVLIATSLLYLGPTIAPNHRSNCGHVLGEVLTFDMFCFIPHSFFLVYSRPTTALDPFCPPSCHTCHAVNEWKQVTSSRDSPFHTVTDRFSCLECGFEKTQYRTWRRKAVVDRVSCSYRLLCPSSCLFPKVGTRSA